MNVREKIRIFFTFFPPSDIFFISILVWISDSESAEAKGPAQQPKKDKSAMAYFSLRV